MNKHAVKFANTAKRLQKALLELLEEKDFINISITDICTKSNINRSTFYAHYDNTMELANELENSLLADFEKETADLIKNQIINEVNNSQGNIFIDEKILSVYLEFVKKYRSVFVIYNKNPIFSKGSHEKILKETVFIPAFKASGINDDILMDFMFKYYLSGINSIINKWVIDDCKIAIETICKIIRICVLRT